MTVRLDEKRGPAMICEGGPWDRWAYYLTDWETRLKSEAWAGREVPYRRTTLLVDLPGSYHKDQLTVWEFTGRPW